MLSDVRRSTCGRALVLLCLLVAQDFGPASVASAQAQGVVIDRIMAVVSGGVILQSDVTAALRFGLVEVPPEGDRTQVALDRLIERRLMLLEVDRYGAPEPSGVEMDAALAAIDARIASGDKLHAILRESGFTLDQLRLWVRDDLRIRAHLQQRFGGSATTPERRASLTREWLASLRRRTEINVLYLPVK